MIFIKKYVEEWDIDLIRVLNIVTIMNRAGLESRLMDIYRNLNHDEIQFDFFTNRNERGDFDDEIVALGGKVYYSEPIRIGREYKKEKQFSNFLLMHQEYKIIHSHINEWSTIFCKGAMKAGVPIRIAHSRGANKSKTLKTFYKNWIKSSLKKYATHYLAVSKEAGIHLFGKQAFNAGDVIIFPNAIDTEKFRYDPKIRAQTRAELGLKDTLTLIHVGNLMAVKNHRYLLRVFEAIKAKNPYSTLIIVGEGNERNNIELFIKKSKLEDSIHLLGKRSDVSRLLQAADVFIFPSFHEGFPGAVLEAETSGLPCYISDTITQEVVITDKVKCISINENPQIWADAILKCGYSNRSDCVKIVSDAGYDIKTLTNKMIYFYKNLMSQIKVKE